MTKDDVVRLIRATGPDGYLVTDSEAGQLVYRYGLQFDLSGPEAIARMVHKNQTDKAGRPYIEHVERVVAGTVDQCLPGMDLGRLNAVAWLHDVLEDSAIGVVGLKALNVPEEVVADVSLLTRWDKAPERYADYIRNLAPHRFARAVKLSDLMDHLRNPGCPESLRPRYEKALAVLLSQP